MYSNEQVIGFEKLNCHKSHNVKKVHPTFGYFTSIQEGDGFVQEAPNPRYRWKKPHALADTHCDVWLLGKFTPERTDMAPFRVFDQDMDVMRVFIQMKCTGNLAVEPSEGV